MLASTSMGAIVTACNQAAQPAVKPARVPKAKYGNRAVPPATGYAAPSSAWISASTASMMAASTQDSSDAGPATVAALSAPSSQPEPMIEPSETNIRPQKPTARCRLPGTLSCAVVTSAVTWTSGWPRGGAAAWRRTRLAVMIAHGPRESTRLAPERAHLVGSAVAEPLEQGDVGGVRPARGLHHHGHAGQGAQAEQLPERGLADGAGAQRLVPVPGGAEGVPGVVGVHQ